MFFEKEKKYKIIYYNNFDMFTIFRRILFFYGPPINKDNLVNKVENYLIQQGENKEGFKSFKVNYHFKSGYYVDVVYKDEPNVIYSYRYNKNKEGKKRVFIFDSRLTDNTNENTYHFKHRHVGEV